MQEFSTTCQHLRSLKEHLTTAGMPSTTKSCDPVNIFLLWGMGVSDLSGPVRDTPTYRTIPFRDSIAEGGIARVCLVFIGHRVGIAEIPPFVGRVSHHHFACSLRGKLSEKGEGVSHPIGHVETPKTP